VTSSSIALLSGACGTVLALTASVGCQEYDSSLLRYSDAGVDSAEASTEASPDAPLTDAEPEADAPDAPDAPDASNDVLQDVASEEAAPPCSPTLVDCDGNEGNGCETDLTSDATNCGACGHSCLGGDCNDGKCLPFVLASGQLTPSNVFLDETHLYWTNQVQGGAVMRVPLLGGVPQVVAQSARIPGGIATDATSVYWSEFSSGGSVWRLDRTDVGDASKAIELVSGQGTSLSVTVDGTRVYWTTPGTVRTMLKTGGGYIQLATDQQTPGGLLAGLGHVFWTNYSGGTVVTVGLANPNEIQVLASDQGAPAGLTADLTNLYWVNNMGTPDGGTPSVVKVARSGNMTPEVLADGQAGPIGVAQLGNYVYWTNNVGGTVMRVLKTGGTPEQLASEQQAPSGIAVDAAVVYWANRDDGTVMALAL
jgi:sugar lactone lactonase YvrE